MFHEQSEGITKTGDISTWLSGLQEVFDVQILGQGSAWASVDEQ